MAAPKRRSRSPKPLHIACKLLGGEHRDPRYQVLPAGVQCFEQTRLSEIALHAARAGIEKGYTDFRLVPRFPQRYGVQTEIISGPREEGNHALTDCAKVSSCEIAITRSRKNQSRNARAFSRIRAFDRGGEKPALVTEMIVHRNLGNTCLCSHLLDGGRGKTVRQKTMSVAASTMASPLGIVGQDGQASSQLGFRLNYLLTK